MKRLFATSIAAIIAAGPVLADQTLDTQTDLEASAETSAPAGQAAGVQAGTETGADAETKLLTGADPDVGQTADGFAPVELAGLTAEDLVGAEVYTPDHEEIGEVAEVIAGDDGSIDRAVIEIGGILGIGEKPVALPADAFRVEQNAEAELRIVTVAGEAELQAMPEFEGQAS